MAILLGAAAPDQGSVRVDRPAGIAVPDVCSARAGRCRSGGFCSKLKAICHRLSPSFRGASEASEPGIQGHTFRASGSGPGAIARRRRAWTRFMAPSRN